MADGGNEPGRHYDTGRGRMYKHPDYKRGFPSVTTIIGRVWPSGYLEDWRVRNLAGAMIADVDDYLERFERIAGKPEAMRILHQDSLKDRLLEDRNDYSAAERGTRIHKAVEVRLRYGKKSAWADGLQAPDERAATVTACKAVKRLGVEVWGLEVPLFGHSPVKYAGTADIIGTFQGDLCVIDLKTGRRVNRAHMPQLAAYAECTEYWAHQAQIIMELPAKITRALILHARPDYAAWHDVDLEVAVPIWEHCALLEQATRSSAGMPFLNQGETE